DLRVARGVVVTGRVLDRSTGKGVPGYVAVDALVDNAFAKNYPPFNLSARFPYQYTADDGSFRVVGLPGRVILMGGPDGKRHALGGEARFRYRQPVPDPNYPEYFSRSLLNGGYARYGGGYAMTDGNWCKVLDIKPGVAVVEQDVLLEPAAELPLLLR